MEGTWQGPVAFRFARLSEKKPANSTRYECSLPSGERSVKFSIYVPDIVFDGEAPPEQLVVTLVACDPGG